ncbi:MAG: PQQ-binding-like beta-propeller repeat protein [Planctomycetaceae bacterium]|jgi:outer membrane protein assembly factor BamB|nr:PQQ-binding-like beta-propeller repeat protein [Planctomycetaceae bacterium]MBT6158221.1 PQQ-binding-like beta-propeller repeat protein [Planctomycetaceae bacterium]MBT6483983.1 PQQ-binding-like beta-propeller repeat protein [Planctomycetaceae bacterium]MBT6496909.1 PQQ-binding-like beta-propeller repeat protein [Planctomycetaceae bacterium]
MHCHATRLLALMIVVLSTGSLSAADWTQFRGKGGLGISEETGLPTSWSSSENIDWKVEMPGPGASGPITLGDRVFITCYTGYGLEPAQGEQAGLVRHLLCLNRKNGETIWHKTFQPKLPEHKYQGEGSYHGYAASTPTTDGKRLYVFFGKSGLFCFDLNGEQLWQSSVGDGTNRWGSGSSPLLYKNLVIVNASVESGSLVALDKMTGQEVWRAKGIGSAWNTPLLVPGKSRTELVVSIANHVVSLDPDTGEEHWRAEGVHRYVCPSVVFHDDVVYAIGGGHTSLAVRTGGTGDVSKSHGVWRLKKGANVSSPIYYKGHLYWTRDGSTVCCQNPKTGEMVYEERLRPGAGRIWSSPVLADSKLYYVSQHKGTFVVAAQPKFKLLAHNTFEEDDSRTNASPAVSNGQLLLRTDRFLYCIGKK